MSPNNCPFNRSNMFKCISLPSCLSAQSQHSKAEWRFQLRKIGHGGRRIDCQYNFTGRSHTRTISSSRSEVHCLALIQWLYTFSSFSIFFIWLKQCPLALLVCLNPAWENIERFYFDGSSRLISANSPFESSNKAAVLPHALKSLSFQRSFVRPSILRMWAICTIWMLDVAVSLLASPCHLCLLAHLALHPKKSRQYLGRVWSRSLRSSLTCERLRRKGTCTSTESSQLRLTSLELWHFLAIKGKVDQINSHLAE